MMKTFLALFLLLIGPASAQDWSQSYIRGIDNQTSTLTTPTQTMTNTAACTSSSTCAWTANALVNGMAVVFTGSVPTPLVAGVTYYVVSQATNAYNVAATPGGAAIVLTQTLSPLATIVVAPNAVISSNKAGGSVVVPSITNVARGASGSFTGRRVRLKSNVTSGWDQTTFTVRLYDTAPTYAAGAGNFQPWSASGYAGFLGQFNVTLNQFVDGASGNGSMPDCGPLFETLTGGGTTIYWDLQYTGTPSVNPITGQTFTIILEEEK